MLLMLLMLLVLLLPSTTVYSLYALSSLKAAPRSTTTSCLALVLLAAGFSTAPIGTCAGWLA